jgi:Putative transposase of IS4/5 family (DUF4096)
MSRYDGRRYPSDRTSAQWVILEPLVPKPSTQGRPPHLERRAIVNAILDVLRSGCRLSVVTPGFSCLADRVLLLPSRASRWYVGSDARHLAHADARQTRPQS